MNTDESLVERLEPRQDWVKFPSGLARQLRALTPLRQRSRILFVGPAGTGKTVAAEILAGDLGLDLYRIDLAALISKYIGETEKQLTQLIETVREKAPAVLLLTRGEALVEVGTDLDHLPRRLRRFPGPVIVAGRGKAPETPGEWTAVVEFA